MKVKFFAIPALDPTEAEDELNRFLGGHRVLTIDRELATERSGTFWAVCVTYLERSATTSPSGKRSKVDYKEVLSPEDFEVFAALRLLRKEMAERDGVPAYAVFTNAQLAEMVQQRMRMVEEVGGIAGVGPSRTESYGQVFLERLVALQGSLPSSDDPPQDPPEDQAQEAE